MSIPVDVIERLKTAAKMACEHAYCPYSQYPVGSAVLTEAGRIYAGCNVENASFGLTICAERNAMFQAVAHGGSRIRAVVIYTPTNVPAAPCGSCRQVLFELGPESEIYSTCDSEDTRQFTVKQLLPEAFELNQV